ncbi:MAG: glycosyltransferase family 4 protein [Pyrinomonadaceae bacterium]|nr:glycosyltransferase family 4 protein [Pyrinomonadaceae bacterium]
MADNATDKIKVAVVAPSMEVLGGQSIQANRLIDAFAKDEEIELTLIPNNPRLKYFSFIQNIRILRTLATSIKFWWLLATRLAAYDLVHVFSSGTTSYVISTLPPLFVSKFFGKHVILDYHTGEAEEHLRNWGWLATSSMREFDAIVVPSQFLVDVFAEFKLKAESIFNFVEAEKFIFRKRETLKPAFLSNRTFEKHYNVASTLRAFKKIQEKYSDAQLIVAGFGNEEAELVALARELDLKNVEFIGKVSQDEMPSVYDSADIYLNSSVVDNMPLSIIEAFSCGLPVVSSNAGGIPYIVEDGETGLLAHKNDHAALAQQACKLLENRELARKIIEKAHKECVKYRWSKIRYKWRSLYLDLLNR